MIRGLGWLFAIALAASRPSASLEATGQTEAASSPAARGKYLTDAGNCVSCHTRSGGAPFSGGVAFDTPLGTIYSTNLTPDPQTGIGRWTSADLVRAMHEGIGADGSHLFPAFPYTAFTKVMDADVADIYAYLRTLKPVHYLPPSNGALFSMRWPVGIWNDWFLTSGRFVPDSTKSAEWNRGAYLVQGLGHCGACHTPRNAFLAEQPDKALQGGVLRSEVAPGKVRSWSAVNLTSSRDGLAAWSVPELTRYLQTGFSPRAGTFGPMNEVIGNSLKLLAPADLHAMAVYIKSLPAAAAAGETVSPQLAQAGASIYKERCEKCHGASGRGGFFSGPALAGSAVVQAGDPASLINIILYGQTTPKDVSLGSWETMQAYGDVLDDDQVVSVSNFVRGTWGNRAAAVSAADVHGQR